MIGSATPHWDRFWGRQTDLERVYRSSPRVLETVLAACPFSGASVLEIGAGSGRDSAELTRRGHRAVALDRSRASLALIRRSAPRLAGRGIVGGDALRLPFRSGTFDVVFHQGVLEHFPDPSAFLAENHRVLRSGGVLVVDVPQTYHPWTLIKRVALRFDRWFAGWETEYTIDELESLVRAAGFEVVSDYGDWMVPSLAYRLVRHAARPIVELPLEPRGPTRLRGLRRRVRERVREPRIARYIAHTIGVVARKPGTPS